MNTEEEMKKQESKQDGKPEKGTRSIKSMLLLCLLYAAVLSTATFAWFSMNNKPKIFNMALKAGASGNLMIADDNGGPGTYGDELDLTKASQKVDMKEVTLSPCTTKEGKKFYSPVYTGARVGDVEEITDTTELNKEYVYEKTFYLKAGAAEGTSSSASSGAKEYNILLVGPKDAATAHSGTYVNKKTGSTAEQTCANTIRISFEKDGETVIPVYEPNSDVHNDGEKADNGLGDAYGKYKTLQQSSSGNFTTGTGGNSEKLFTITEGVDTKITMRVWVEGSDDDCTNKTQLDEIEANIQFTSQKADGTTGN